MPWCLVGVPRSEKRLKTPVLRVVKRADLFYCDWWTAFIWCRGFVCLFVFLSLTSDLFMYSNSQLEELHYG